MHNSKVLQTSIALTGVGASLCASGSQVCIGARPGFGSKSYQYENKSNLDQIRIKKF